MPYPNLPRVMRHLNVPIRITVRFPLLLVLCVQRRPPWTLGLNGLSPYSLSGLVGTILQREQISMAGHDGLTTCRLQITGPLLSVTILVALVFVVSNSLC